MNLREVGDELLFDDSEHYTAKHRSPDSSNSANHRRQQNVNAGLKCKYTLRVNECCVACEDSASNPSHRSGYRMNRQLVFEGIDADIAGRIFVLFDRF